MPAPALKRQVVIDSNDQCYVCHMPFVEESLAAAHAKVQVWCGTCHGPSTPHIEDENIGATPPDIVHKRDEVDRMCGQCHDPEEHAILTGKTRRARLAGGRKAQEEIKGRKIEATGVCTDCHGRHWIPPRGQQAAPQGNGADPGAGSTTRVPIQAHLESRTTPAPPRVLRLSLLQHRRPQQRHGQTSLLGVQAHQHFGGLDNFPTSVRRPPGEAARPERRGPPSPGNAGEITARQSTPGRNRTCDLRFRKPSLYPLSYRRATCYSTDPNGIISPRIPRNRLAATPPSFG